MAQGLLGILNLYGSVLGAMLWCPFYCAGGAFFANFLGGLFSNEYTTDYSEARKRAGSGARWLMYYFGGTLLGARWLDTSDAPIWQGDAFGNVPHGHIGLVIVALAVGVLPICRGWERLEAWLERRQMRHLEQLHQSRQRWQPPTERI